MQISRIESPITLQIPKNSSKTQTTQHIQFHSNPIHQISPSSGHPKTLANFRICPSPNQPRAFGAALLGRNGTPLAFGARAESLRVGKHQRVKAKVEVFGHSSCRHCGWWSGCLWVKIY